MVKAQATDAVLLHASDNVCVATRDLPAGTRLALGTREVTLAEPVRLGHKIALTSVEAGEPFVKYGQTIGFAESAVEPGQWIHSHNLTAGQFAREYRASTEIPPEPQP